MSFGEKFEFGATLVWWGNRHEINLLWWSRICLSVRYKLENT